jgi:hypothetical protein
MQINKIIKTSENVQMADKSAVGAINRPLRAAELFRECALSGSYASWTSFCLSWSSARITCEKEGRMHL